jgi:uncharacterized membrane-anchored protein YhcB (DUF1043 family)
VNNDEAEMKKTLVRDYQSAVLDFNAASTALIRHLAAESLPGDDLIAAEEDSRAAVVGARQKLWDLYRKA